jgi:hypothetical protein
MKQPRARDRNGRDIVSGDKVRVMGVPDLSGMSSACIEESLPVFRHLVGRYETVAGIDEYGNAQLIFLIARGKLKGWHAVMIEPFLLNRPIQRRQNNAFKGRQSARAAKR